jgi:phosphoglucosamine mutase
VSRRFFGTDGIRGVANEKLTPELAFSLGKATGLWLRENGASPNAVIGRDTRRSGPMLAASLSAGFCSVGVTVLDLGVVPTPTVSFVGRTGDFGIAVVISASHNPAPDNGIKLMGHDGRKLSDGDEERIESLLVDPEPYRPTGTAIGTIEPGRGGVEAYLDFLVGLVPEGLHGLKVAVDAAHGAAYELGPEVLRRLGAEVITAGVAPNGDNINAEGGATKPETVQRLTVDSGADIGVAFDGDADRAVFSDERGRLINGDRTIGIWSTHWQNQGKLDPPVVVGTVMSNGGFEKFLEERSIKLERAPVGDKYVAQRIGATGALIGGEQSGHIIFPQHGPTGDGLVTMLELLRTLRREARPTSAFYDDYESWPQLLVNVSINERDGWDLKPRVREALDQAERDLQGKGRLVVRPSGTQPMIRVMVEASEYPLRDRVAESIIGAMAADLGGTVYSRVDLTHALGD